MRLLKSFLPRPSHSCQRCILLCFPCFRKPHMKSDFYFFEYLGAPLSGAFIGKINSSWEKHSRNNDWIWTWGKTTQIGCFSCGFWFPATPQTLPKFRESFNTTKVQSLSCFVRENPQPSRSYVCSVERFSKPKCLSGIFGWLVTFNILLMSANTKCLPFSVKWLFSFMEWPWDSLNLGRIHLAVWG